MSDYFIIVKSISDRQKILDYYEFLPQVLRHKIIEYSKSKFPVYTCCECKGLFYKFTMSNYEHVCEPCSEYYGFSLACP